MTPAAIRNAMVVCRRSAARPTASSISPPSPAGTGIDFDLGALDEIGRKVPVLIDLKPTGAHYMEHFHHAGGVPRLLAQLGDLIDLDAGTVEGGTLRDVVANAEDVPGQDVIRPRSNPIKPEGSMVVLHGNLAPGGAIIKQAAATRTAAPAHGPRHRFRLGRRHGRAHRRS